MSGRRWFYLENGEERGPLLEAGLPKLLEERGLSRETLVCSDESDTNRELPSKRSALVSTWVRLLIRLTERIEEGTLYLWFLLGLTLLVVYFTLKLALSLHHNFLVVACDTAAFQNTLVNLLHGHFFRDTAYEGPNLLGLHTFFILLLLMPIYAMSPYPETLFALHVLGIYGAVIPLYLVALEQLKRPIVAFLVAIFGLVNPAFVVMSVAPFHPENWIIMGVLFVYYCYLRNVTILFWCSVAFTLSCGEISAPIFISLGLALLLIKDDLTWSRAYGFRLLFSGLGWIAFNQIVLLPLMHSPQQQNLVDSKYPDWHVTSLAGLAGAVITNPGQAFSTMFSADRVYMLFQSFGLIMLLIPMYSRSLILMLPLPIFFLMTHDELFLDFHIYYLEFALIAGLLALIWFLKDFTLNSRVCVLFLIVALFWSIHRREVFVRFYEDLLVGVEPELNRDIRGAFQHIPADCAVYSPHRFSAFLSNRDNMVMGDVIEANGEQKDFYAMVESKYPITQVHMDQIAFIVCDCKSDQTGRGTHFNAKRMKARFEVIASLLNSGKWKLFWAQPDEYVMILCRSELKID